MSQVITPAEAAKLADETLAFLLTLCENNEGTERAQEIIKTEQARRVAAGIAAANEAIARDAAIQAEIARNSIELNGFRVTIVEADKRSNGTAKLARTYLSWGVENETLAAMRKALPEPKDKGEDAENDRAYNRYNRAYTRYACELTAQAVAALVQAGKLRRTWKAWGGKYSKYAGCSCPCSQGVVGNQTLWTEDGVAVEIHISPIA